LRIAVTGAFSYSGKYITRRLLEAGEEVLTLTNHPHHPDPFGGKVKAYPLNFNDEAELTAGLKGTQVLVNTYWVRFDKGANTQPRAVENTRLLVKAAINGGIKKIIHISITNPSSNSQLPYFRGKAANEKSVMDSGLDYAILRPTVLFGTEDILINNIAWILRRFPVFALPGDGTYRLQPVFVDDVAKLVSESLYEKQNILWDAVGPDIFTFREMVELIGKTIGCPRPIIPLPPRLSLAAAQFISLFVRDVILTPEEVDGLMAGLLISAQAPRCVTRLEDWLMENKEQVGTQYASELFRHY
jgi:uncharacterized protein YbjT (DUF2867 family)